MYRSRLTRLEERRNLRKATWLAGGTVVLVVTVVILGIPILVKMAGFLGDLKSSSRPVDKNDLIPPVPPAISLPYDATNSARIEIAGSAEPGSTVYLTQNSESQGNAVVGEDGIFRFRDVALKDGNNKFEAVAVDQSGNKSQPSSGVMLLFSNKPPELKIESPTDRQQVSGEMKVEIKGSTGSDVRLTVNERTVIVNSSGKFATTLSLNSGENALVFVAVDRAGNQTRKELTVTAIP